MKRSKTKASKIIFEGQITKLQKAVTLGYELAVKETWNRRAEGEACGGVVHGGPMLFSQRILYD